LIRESVLWASLSHPHILPLIGISLDLFKELPCMVTPWCANGNSKNFLQEQFAKAPVIDDIAVQQLYQAAQGLSYLHSEGLIHGDLRGANVMVDDTGNARLIDFGLSVLADSVFGFELPYVDISTLSHGGGATRWLAPELIDPEQYGLKFSRPTFRTDVYAFSMLAIETSASLMQLPFPDMRDSAILRHVLSGRRPFRPSLPDGSPIPDELWDLIAMCWSHNPEDRPPIEHVVKAMEDIVASYIG
ncbi:kinase-like domain-containing protein, partial [Cristinia sonorae]